MLKILTDLKVQTRERFNDYRSMYTILQSSEFEECLSVCPNDQRVKDAILAGDTGFVKKWIKDKLRLEITDYSARQLRYLASQLGILQYCSKTKSQLLIEIIAKQRAIALAKLTEMIPEYLGNIEYFLENDNVEKSKNSIE